MNTGLPIRVLLADDHALIMTGFARELDEYGVKVVGETKNPDEVLLKYEELKPDVLVLDIRFGDKFSGFDAARDVLSKYPNVRIIFLSQFDQDTVIKEAYKIGAKAFITKVSDSELLAAAIQKAHEGDCYFLPEVAERLAQLAIQGDTSPESKLDARELEIFKSMALGLTNAEIVEQTGLSTKSISNISLAIKDKLGAYRQADLTRLAVRHRLIPA